MEWLRTLLRWLTRLLEAPRASQPYVSAPPIAVPTEIVSPPAPLPAPATTTPMEKPNPDTLVPWDMERKLTHANFHNVRVLCDLEGLTYDQKEELTATVWAESEFYVHAVCYNYGHDAKGNKYLASTDHGIAQWNDYYHGSSHLNLFNASTTNGTITFTTNNTITSGDKTYVDIGTPATSPTRLNCTVKATY